MLNTQRDTSWPVHEWIQKSGLIKYKKVVIFVDLYLRDGCGPLAKMVDSYLVDLGSITSTSIVQQALF